MVLLTINSLINRFNSFSSIKKKNFDKNVEKQRRKEKSGEIIKRK